MESRDFFSKINFNKPWTEDDWEKYFEAHEAYRLTVRNHEVKKKQAQRVQFDSDDEVEAFEPILKAYGLETTPDVVYEIKNQTFEGDEDPDNEYAPPTTEDPHFWGEGAPLASLPIYRDCCRFAISTHHEIDRYLKRRKPDFRKKFSAEFETLRFHSNWIAVDVAQGHQIGYSKDRIQGNIAKVRRAVKHADMCIKLMNRISLRTRSSRLRHELFSFSAQLRNALYMWIDELRSRLN